MIPLPNRNASFTDKVGRIISVWASYLQQFTQAPANLIHITVGASPFSYTALEPGTILISGGTFSGIALRRGNTTVALGAAIRAIPVSINDIVILSYSVVPTSMVLAPAYGQNTGA